MDRLIASNTVAVGSGDTAPATGTPGQATSGNPATNTPATVFPAYAFNALQEELIAVLAAGGVTPDRNNNAQVAAAIKRIGQNTIVLADTGAVNAYTAVNATPLVSGTWVDGVIQAVKIAHANTGASTYAPDGLPTVPIYGLGLQPLQGGELALNGTAILMRATIAGVNSGNPIVVLMECAGGAQQVPPATQSQHAMQLGQATGRLLNVRTFTSSGTYTPTTGTTSVVVEVQGGGGGGGGTANTGAGQVSVGGGGGGGAYSKTRITSGFSGVTMTIGSGGAGGTAAGGTGGTGGTTSFGALISAAGGSGGIGGSASSPPYAQVGGAGGTASGSGTIVNTGGNAGATSTAAAVASFVSGAGGGSILGAGGPSLGTSTSVGNPASGYGGGGGGAANGASTSGQVGGGGSQGVVTVWEYA